MTTPSRAAAAPTPTTPGRGGRALTVATGVLVLAGVTLAVLRPPWLTEPLQNLVEAGGAAAPLVFVLLCVLSVPFHLAPVLVVLSPLLFPLPEALLLSLVGTLLGCLLTAAALSRAGAAAAAGQGRWPAWLTRLSRQVDRRPLLIGILVRVVLNAGLAVEAFFLFTGYSRRPYLIATIGGITLWVTQAVVGVSVLHALFDMSPVLAFAALVAPLAAVAVPVHLSRHRRRARN